VNRPMARRILRLSLLVFPLLTSALHNITVDDNAPAIVYSGSWSSASGTTVGDYGGTRHWTNSTADPTATATFTFIGIALYYWSPKWPYPVTTQLNIDGGQTVLLDLQDHTRSAPEGAQESISSQIVWGITGLSNTTHTLVASAGAGQWVEVDAFTYTVFDASDAGAGPITPTVVISTGVPSSASTVSNGAASTSTSVSSASSKTVVISIIAALVVAVLVLAAFVIYLLRRRRRRNERRFLTQTQASRPQPRFTPRRPGHYHHFPPVAVAGPPSFPLLPQRPPERSGNPHHSYVAPPVMPVAPWPPVHQEGQPPFDNTQWKPPHPEVSPHGGARVSIAPTTLSGVSYDMSSVSPASRSPDPRETSFPADPPPAYADPI
jgi:hypothetical protein